MLKIFILFFSFLFIASSTLKSENAKLEYMTFEENSSPKSRLLLENQIEKKVPIKKKNIYNNKSEKQKQEKDKPLKKLGLQKKNNEFEVNFMPEKEKPTDKEIKLFYNNLVKLNKKNGIIIKGYAQKRENDSTSKVRRLSLKRALFLRSLLLKENYDISKIYIKALGHDTKLKGNRDVVIITNN